MAVGIKNPWNNQPTGNQAAGGASARAGNVLSMPGQPISEKWLRNWFIAALGAGSAVIITTWKLDFGFASTILWPVLIMAIYIAVTLTPAKASSQRDQIGDSWYYLGFLFTLVALAVSMYVFSESVDTDAEQKSLLARIGVSLITSIVGLASRLVLTQFTITTEDAQNTITQQANALVSSARKTHEDLKDHTDQFRQALKDSVNELKKTNTSANSNIRKSIDKHTKSIDDLLDANSNLIEGTNSIFENGVTAAIESLKQKFDDLEIMPSGAQGSVGQTIAGLNTAISSLQTSLEDADLASSGFVESISPISPLINSMGTDLAKIAGASSQLDGIGKQLIETTTNLSTLNLPLSMVVDEIKNVPASAAETLADLKAEFEAVRQLRDKLARELTDTMELNKKTVSSLTNSLDTLARAIERVASGNLPTSQSEDVRN
jgi:ABC-type transporter Mla subunit MlaD